MKALTWAVFAFLGVLTSCSILNREGPDVTCADLDNGSENACEDDIIATCTNGKVTYEVCDVGACGETWQTDGKFRCDQGDPVPDTQGGGGTGGSSGTGGTGGTSGIGGSSGTGGSGATGGSGGCDPSSACVIVDVGLKGIDAMALYGSNVYFSDGESVQSVPKTGGFSTVLASGLTIDAQWQMSADSSHVYVRQGNNQLVRAPISGGSLETYAENVNGPFTTDEQNVYWGGWSQVSGTGLWIKPKTSGEQNKLVESLNLNAYNRIAVRDGYLYWMAAEGISRVPTTGPYPTSPASIPIGETITSFAVGADALFFVSQGNEAIVGKVPFAGGGVTALASAQTYPTDIAIDDSYVYWDAQTHTGTAIFRAGVSGEAPSKVSDVPSELIKPVMRLLVDSTHIYWADCCGIWRAPK